MLIDDDDDDGDGDNVDALRAQVAALKRQLASFRATTAIAAVDVDDAPLFSAHSSAHVSADSKRKLALPVSYFRFPQPFAVSKANVEQFFKAQPLVRDVRGRVAATDATWHLHFYDFFCLDHWPLLELRHSVPSDVDSIRVPRYERFLNVPLPLPLDMTDEQLLATYKRGGAPSADDLRSACFNCGDKTHSVSACPRPRNSARIAANRDAFRVLRQTAVADGGDERYWGAASRQQEMATQFSAGVLSPELRSALNIGATEIPEFTKRMRALGGVGPTYATLIGTADEIRMPGVNVDVPIEATQRYNPFAVDDDDDRPLPPPPPTTTVKSTAWTGYS
jgi:hypothetical protein